ncbi:rhodanese-like domain-containing protein [Sulfurovum sp.]|uniref:sulfurtransferase n=1 Tax=Sulfurovum sp. TaxID=1969726 RepID=UPI002867B598|nr:rhodanese-like domain-containing protein [Sulfurovum sp.]
MKFFILLVGLAMPLMAIEPIVTAQWLNEHKNDSHMRIVEVSGGDLYSSEHIPNAVHTSIDKWRYDNGTFLSVRPVAEIEAETSRLGIDENSNVILYAPIKEPIDLLKASYIYWALHYHGVRNVALLDGGLEAWRKSKLPLTNIKPSISKTPFKASLDKNKIADMHYVKNALGKIPMIDARPSDMYLGVTPTPTVKRNGHIAGAMSYSWNYSVEKDYRLKPKMLLENVFKEGYKLDKTKEILVYCTGGLETSFNYFVLNGVLGYKNIRLYDASMKEWGNTENTPMEKYKYEMFQK